jgi:hypothetical protein
LIDQRCTIADLPRLWFAPMAYVLVCALRRIALRHTQFAEATCGTIASNINFLAEIIKRTCPIAS